MLNRRKASKIQWLDKHRVYITWMDGSASLFSPNTPDALLTEGSFTTQINRHVAIEAIAQYAEQSLTQGLVSKPRGLKLPIARFRDFKNEVLSEITCPDPYRFLKGPSK